MVVTMRDPQPYLRELRRLRQTGYGVIVLACGDAASADAMTARRAGFAARAMQLDGPWQTATQLAAVA